MTKSVFDELRSKGWKIREVEVPKEIIVKTADVLREQDLYFGNVEYLNVALHGLSDDQRHCVESVILGCIAARTPHSTWHRVVDLAVKEIRG